jgi:hypothetical protein
VLAVTVPVAHGATFTLASSGCSQKHCTAVEDNKIGFSTPAPSTTGGSLALYTPNSGPNPAGAGDALSDGCSSNGTIVACTSHTSPFLLVFGQNGDMIYNSCGGTDPTNPTTCAGTEVLNVMRTTPLIGTDNSVITADNHRIMRFYAASTYSVTKYSDVSAMSGLTLGLPQGAIYTQAPKSGSTIGLITLLFENGPAVTFNSGALGDSAAGYGFIALDEIGSGTPCGDTGTCFYSGTNSACAVTLYDTDDNITGRRIYAVVNQTKTVSTAPSDTEQYYGRVYALTITTSGISETWYYDFVSNGFVGPSSASPMCSPNGHIFTDYGSVLQDADICSASGFPPPNGTSCGAGVVGLIDCASPFSCSGSTTYLAVSGYPLAIVNLPTDASGHGTGASEAGQFFNANFSYDFVNGCYWVHPNGLATVSCLSTTSASVLAAINVAYLANGVTTHWNTIFPISNITVATSPTNSSDAAIIMGAQTTTTNGGYSAVLAVDTGKCSSATCTTSWVSCPGGLTCSTSWSTSPALSWYFDLKFNSGGIAAGQFVVVTDTSDNPCLVVFTDNLQGTWFLSAPGEAQGGCAE